MKKSVDQYILNHPDWHDELVLLRGILCKSELVEAVKWGAPIYTINGKNIVGIGAFKSYVGLWFFQGVFLKDREKVLINAQEGKTKAMRQWRFNSSNEINNQLIKKYVDEAITNQKQGKELKPAKSQSAVLPEELTTLLKADKALKSEFEELAPYKQKEYAEYISEAKRSATKEGRLTKIKVLILAGIGLNDRYR